MKLLFIGLKTSVLNMLRFFLIYIDEILPVQSSEFIKPLCFGSHLKKKKLQKIPFRPKNRFENKCFEYVKILSDLY